MSPLSHSAFLQQLAWSLLSSLWQFAALWLVYIIFSFFFKKASAAVKYNIALMLLSVGTITVMGNFIYRYWFHPDASFSIVGYAHEHYNTLYQQSLNYFNAVLPYISIVYLGAVLFLSLRFLFFIRASYLLNKRDLVKISPVYKIYIQELSMRMSIKKKVSVWISKNVDAPLLIGYFKPVILLPVAAINQLTAEQLEAILLHEMAHIQRNDYFVNVLLGVVNIMLFFNPFAKLFIKVLETERENSCDDLVLQFRYSPEKYAKALLTLEHNRLNVLPSLSLSSNGKNEKHLLTRVKRIMNVPVDTKINKQQLVFPLLLLLFSFALFVQPTNKETITPLTPTMQTVSFSSAGANGLSYNYLLRNNKPVAEMQGNIQQTRMAANTDKQEIKVSVQNILASVKIKRSTSLETKQADELAPPPPPAPQLVAVSYDAPNAEPIHVETVQSIEKRDFVIPAAPQPHVKINISTNSPYVPGSSFSYYNIQDSINALSSEDHALKLALVKASVALDMAKQANICNEEKLVLNLEQSLTSMHYYEKDNVAKVIDMQSTALVQMLVAKADKQQQLRDRHVMKIDSLQKEIRVVRKRAVVSL
ncbi:M56 family metallopeptidase [Pinibacter aurantiacus]|uniref:M56 family metallopeptidase n=1 Tax=Pinibacter aurantiacus TaxID=2851599 RepID=A0A9E2S5T8_9BACT|nr:M56 family metallopeptidase [Pinibacter aurantiacus]MBV4355753.1 M56 family metallopeptidase [Pinibacter aurantiacus]